jgi:hypothetical protein
LNLVTRVNRLKSPAEMRKNTPDRQNSMWEEV